MKRKYKSRLYQYVGEIPIIPIKERILCVFVLLMLLTAVSTNYISAVLSQNQLVKLNNDILSMQLKDIYTNAVTQYQISAYTKDVDTSIASLKLSALNTFSDNYDRSVAFGLNKDGTFLFLAAKGGRNSDWNTFTDKKAIALMIQSEDGSITFDSPDGETYFGVYKYNPQWNCWLVRAEHRHETKLAVYRVFALILCLIIVITMGFLFVGTKILNRLLGGISSISQDLYHMQQMQKMGLINIDDLPNDDITYLAANFNSLSSTVDNLITIFQKFVPENVVRKVHKEQTIRLEGSQKELAILFSDIKGFTFRTEVLQDSIIKLLNVHYDSVIKQVSDNNGVIGSIVGDAILASYGIENTNSNKSVDAIRTAWKITEVTNVLRHKLSDRKTLMEEQGIFTDKEQEIYDAMMVDVGVGIDGGTVFYGNIGSNQRMTNTVIGDNVNSASRLEGLTRIYRLPVIVSEYIKQDTMNSGLVDSFEFFEIDRVQVKGKTEGVRIYIPIEKDCKIERWRLNNCRQDFIQFEKGLELYYRGEWTNAQREFKKCNLEVARVFIDRIKGRKVPENWSGIWTMTSK